MAKRWSWALVAALSVSCGEGDFGDELAEGRSDGPDGRSLKFFSQLDPAWKNDKLGHCNETIGSAGCAITATAMALTSLGVDVTPKTLNVYLRDHGGYDEYCNIVWAKAAGTDPTGQVTWLHKFILSSPEAIRNGLNEEKRVIAKSKRFTEHWVYIVGYDGDGAEWNDFTYLDPYDTSPIYHHVGDGKVDGGAITSVYQ